MTVRRGTLYVGVFLLAAGAVTLGVATALLDRDVVANTVVALWPLAVIAIGVGLVFRRSPAALVAGVIAAAVPGLALGASVVAGPDIAVPCTDTSPAPAQAVAHDGTFGTAATIDLSLSCGELTMTAQPGNAWHLDARDGANRRTDVAADATRLSATTPGGSGGWNRHAGRVDWEVVLPTQVTIDLTTEINAGRGRLNLAGTRLGDVDMHVNAADVRVDLAGATLDRVDLDVNAGSAAITLPADSFEGDLHANAGSLDLCVPDQLALRLRSTAALGSIDHHGLVQRGTAWETPDYATAPFKADLAIDASLGSVTINPKGGCK
ncbi:MAG: DUF4097 domain-containing protein [Chloroflexi bacterium]|nr:DUF4097 domain-containing protein [Chloroflexota bacterium]